MFLFSVSRVDPRQLLQSSTTDSVSGEKSNIIGALFFIFIHNFQFQKIIPEKHKINGKQTEKRVFNKINLVR